MSRITAFLLEVANLENQCAEYVLKPGQKLDVDDFVADKARNINIDQLLFTPGGNRFNINQIRSTKFNRFQ